mmetsp:Transcript_31191/g.68356  ORF Transcript_31191/g.68356 Transcript_31191/m.68356 type:complete len:224 (-) Transcript_31191:387-1058(-)
MTQMRVPRPFKAALSQTLAVTDLVAEVEDGLKVEPHAESVSRRRLWLLRLLPAHECRRCRWGIHHWCLALQSSLVPGIHLVPVHHIPPSRNVLWSTVLVLQVVGMLPDIKSEDGDALHGIDALHERIVLICRGGEHQFAIFHDYPGPARAEERRRSSPGRKFILESVQRTKGLVDSSLKRCRGLATCARRCHLQPEEVVVPDSTACVAVWPLPRLDRSFDQVE